MAQAKDLTLYDVENGFSLQRTTDPQFFTEWSEELPPLTDLEQQLLDRVQSNYFSLIQRRPMLESAVKMVVLSPLLDLAGFYQLPFEMVTEESVTISAVDDGELVQGRIDVLVLQNQFWFLVIESKRAKFDVLEALPQALTYMIGSPHPEKPIFGLITNGREIILIKLTRQDAPKYALSKVFSILNPGNDLYEALKVLKQLGELVLIS